MDDSLRLEIERAAPEIRPWLFMIAKAESNGNPRAVNRGGGGRGAHGAFQMRQDALADSGYTIEQVSDSIRMQVAAAARYLVKIVLPGIRAAGRSVNIDSLAQAWHDGPYSFGSGPSFEVTRPGGWIDRALGAARYIATPVITSFSDSVDEVKKNPEWMRIVAWSFVGLSVTVASVAAWRKYR